MERTPIFPGLSGAFETLLALAFFGLFLFFMFKVGSCIMG